MISPVSPSPVHDHIRSALPEQIRRVREFLMQPSVSVGDHGVRDCAEMLKQRFLDIGCQTAEVAETPKLPAVWASLDAGAEVTLAVYGFFDTNIVGGGWSHDPYGGVMEGRGDFPQVLYGRGCSNKGGLMSFTHAIEALTAVNGKPPVNVLFLCEGEEFTGSLHIPLLIERYRSQLEKANGLVWPGPCQTEAGSVDLALGNKGCLHIELVCRGEAWGRGPQGAPAHSSTMGIVDHPVWRLVHALSTMYDPQTAEILVPGFTDGLREPTADDLKLTEELARANQGSEAASFSGISSSEHVPRFVKDVTGAAAYRRYCFLPTMNINGIRGGYTGPGTTLWTLPHEAACTIDHRLPPDLDPEVCQQRIREHLDRQGYEDIEIRTLMSVGSATVQLGDELAQAALSVFTDWGVEPMIWPRRGASGPTGSFGQLLGIQAMGSTGLGYASGHSSGDEFLVIEGNDRVGGLEQLTCSQADLMCSFAEKAGGGSAA